MEHDVELLKLCSFLAIQITHLTVTTFPGQLITNENDDVYRAT